jgi:hypothetical protein
MPVVYFGKKNGRLKSQEKGKIVAEELVPE